MWFGTLCLVTVLILLVLYHFRRPRRFPPGPRGLPILGNLLDIAKLAKKEKLYCDTWCRLADQYGPVVGLRLGFKESMIIVSGKEAVTIMMNRPEFDGRPNGFMYKYRCGGKMQGLVFTDSDFWKGQKKFTMKTLMQVGFGKMFSHVWFLLEGTKFEVGMESPQLKEVIKVLKDILINASVVGGIVNYFPFLRLIFPGFTGFSLFAERQKRIDGFFMDVISKHKKDRVFGESTNFIDSYLQKIEIEKQNSSFNESQLQYVFKDLFSASVDTTEKAIGFIIAYLVVHQDVQLRVHDEIDRVIGISACPSLGDKSRLPYLNAVVTEVSRLANVAPTSIPHRAMTDTSLLGFEIKRDYILLANFKSIHLDKEHWGDPETFRPERFIDEEGRFIDDPWVMNFGAGHRRCPGEVVARNAVFLFTACLMQKLHFMLPKKHPKPDLNGHGTFITAPPTMEVVVRQRH
ncbi:PREDICTED: LOW QUALITY PROTEIN: methyl farnesoate epoxidase-like [Dufourea novaeangliae]|uniref:LOW QUALITY PROTEIN: methyl farnesoate epoxidase-like n=1 Tax=Dufourea novaeangliae TaxID=178035 RepID=UPI0007679699|nr:PREDICTED: LOW QUALITY PROTEIN: methyl farnesoate epoxidase-like [Dufourea novaeangliae]